LVQEEVSRKIEIQKTLSKVSADQTFHKWKWKDVFTSFLSRVATAAVTSTTSSCKPQQYTGHNSTDLSNNNNSSQALVLLLV